MNLSNIDVDNYAARILFQKSAIEYSIANTVMHISYLENQKMDGITMGDLKNPMNMASKAFRGVKQSVKNYLNSWFIDELPIHEKGLDELQKIVDKSVDLLNTNDDNNLDIAEDLLQKHGLWQTPSFQILQRTFKENDVNPAVISRLKEEWISNSKKTLMILKQKTDPQTVINATQKKIIKNIIFAGSIAATGALIFGISGTGSGILALGITFLKGIVSDFQKDKGIKENIKIGIKGIYEYFNVKKGLHETSEVFENLNSSLKKPPTTKMRRKYLAVALDQLNLYHDVMAKESTYLLNRENLVPFLSKTLKIEKEKALVKENELEKIKKNNESNDQFFYKSKIAKKLNIDPDTKPYFFNHFNRLVNSERNRVFRRRQGTVENSAKTHGNLKIK